MLWSKLSQYFKRLATTAFVLVACASANALTITDALGRVANGVAADGVTDAMMVNSIVARANGTSPAAFDIAGKTYTLLTDPAPILPFAVWVSTGAVGGDNLVNIGAGGFSYLTIKYDGAEGSELVFDVQGVVGNLPVPATDLGFGANQYSLFNSVGSGTPGSVPDGGATVLLLGSALAILGAARKFMS
jgi:hypothetical protein